LLYYTSIRQSVKAMMCAGPEDLCASTTTKASLVGSPIGDHAARGDIAASGDAVSGDAASGDAVSGDAVSTEPQLAAAAADTKARTSSITAVVVGPGRGRLVAFILAACEEFEVNSCRVLCVETNALAIGYLRSRFGNDERVTLVHAALKPDDTHNTLPPECAPFIGVSGISS
jgi:hypothetical protein